MKQHIYKPKVSGRKRMISVTAVKDGRLYHVGMYADEATANRVKENIEDFVPKGFTLQETK